MTDRQRPTFSQILQLRRELHGPGLLASSKLDASDSALQVFRLQLLSEIEAQEKALGGISLGQTFVPPDILKRIDSLEKRVTALEEQHRSDE